MIDMGIKSFFQDKVIWPIVKPVIVKKLKGNAMIKWLQGKKAYFVGAIGIIVTGLVGTGYIDQKTYEIIVGILGSLGLWALRAGVSKTNGKK